MYTILLEHKDGDEVFFKRTLQAAKDQVKHLKEKHELRRFMERMFNLETGYELITNF